jgi:serine/threonine protein kinase
MMHRSCSDCRAYRAPELIFAPQDYGGEIDVWSFGCTVAELFTPKHTLFSDGADYDGLGSDLVLLGSIVSTLGTPTSETWPESTSRVNETDNSQIFQRLGQDSAEYETSIA